MSKHTLSQEDLELGVLADFVYNTGLVRKCLDEGRLEEELFVTESHRAAFRRLCEVAPNDCAGQVLYGIVAKELGFVGNDAMNAFCERASVSLESVDGRVDRLGMNCYNRRIIEAVTLATNDISDMGDARALVNKITDAIEAIPKPLKSGVLTDEEQAAEAMRQEDQAEIPEELLHVPGFIDEVMKYTLRASHVPNRTLAFAGALALTAHLAGRRYTDGSGTFTNLFVFALGPSGCGKDAPRLTNLRLLRAKEASPDLKMTVFEQAGSGQALETALAMRPRSLFQMDEIQKTLQGLKDTHDTTSCSIAQYLMALFTASKSTHTLRATVKNKELIGSYIEKPALTLFATGNARESYRAFTPSLIKEGLLGRCLMFDTDVRNPLNSLDDDIPEPPEDLLRMMMAINDYRGRGCDATDHCEPGKVPVLAEAKIRRKEILDMIDKRINACRDHNDEISEALRARASEKVSKLALIAAISASPIQPEIKKVGCQSKCP